MWLINIVSKTKYSGFLNYLLCREAKKLLFSGAVIFISLFFIQGEILADDSGSLEDPSLLEAGVVLQNDCRKSEPFLLKADNSRIGAEEGIVIAINHPNVLEEIEVPAEVSQEKNPSEGEKAREIIRYTIKENETLSEIAASYGLKTQTLLWMNNLKENSIIKPGDKITIPPEDGLMHTVKSGDVLGTIADVYKVDVNEITKWNRVDPDKIAQGQKLFIPGGKMPPPPPPKPKQISTSTLISKPAVSYSSSSSGCHSFPYGYCTWYVAQKRGCVPWGGDAKHWLANARAYGYKTGSEPVPGAVMVTRESWWGHVAYVESVKGNSVTISEMNKHGWGRTNYRTLNKNSGIVRGYIYWK